MKIIEENDFGSVYKKLVDALFIEGKEVNGTKEINNCIVIVKKPSLNFILPYKKFAEKYNDAELKWYFSGDNSCKTIGQYAKMWLSISDDGKTNNSAYGYILFKKYGYNQVEQIIELLKKDPGTRRAVLNISDPTLNRIETKDMQCTIAIDFLLRDGKLEETVIMRSNDVRSGFTNDIIFFTALGKYIADQLGVELGTYTHHAISMHMYARDFDYFKENKDTLSKVDVNWKHYIEEYYEK